MRLKNFLTPFVYITAALALVFIVNLAVSRIVAEVYYNKISIDGKHVKIDGVDLYYVKKGTGNPIVLLHGIFGSHLLFELVVDRLAEHHTVYIVELPGFGFSNNSSVIDCSMKNTASLVINLMNKEGIEKFDVVGNSMGGEVALNLAYYHSESIGRLILVNSAGYCRIVSSVDGILKNRLFCSFVIKNILLTYPMQKMFFEGVFYNRRALDNSIFLRNFSVCYKIPAGTLHAIAHSNDCGALRDRIKDIKVPTLVIWGKEDKFIPVEDAYRFNRDIQGSRITVIEKCGHMPFMEKPVEFVEAVENFLKQGDGSFASFFQGTSSSKS